MASYLSDRVRKLALVQLQPTSAWNFAMAYTKLLTASGSSTRVLLKLVCCVSSSFSSFLCCWSAPCLYMLASTLFNIARDSVALADSSFAILRATAASSLAQFRAAMPFGEGGGAPSSAAPNCRTLPLVMGSGHSSVCLKERKNWPALCPLASRHCPSASTARHRSHHATHLRHPARDILKFQLHALPLHS